MFVYKFVDSFGAVVSPLFGSGERAVKWGLADDFVSAKFQQGLVEIVVEEVL